MTVTAAFFEQLARTAYDPRFTKVRGSVRLEIHDGEQVDKWLITIDDGRFRVDHGDGPASSVTSMSAPLAERLLRGEINALAAILRGEILVDGDLGLALRLGRLLPAPPADPGIRIANGKG